MVPLLGTVRLFNEVIVFYQFGIPVVGFTAEKSIEPVEPFLTGAIRQRLPPLEISSTGTLWFLPSQNVP